MQVVTSPKPGSLNFIILLFLGDFITDQNNVVNNKVTCKNISPERSVYTWRATLHILKYLPFVLNEWYYHMWWYNSTPIVQQLSNVR
jgi:hypothetical protein